MNNSPFNDDTLSAIIDGEADDATIASVAQNPSASARLEQLRAASKLVASPVGDATPERRAASIAAAMKAADPSTGVSSLAVRREAKRKWLRPQWFAAAAAVLLVLVALPLLARLSESDADLTSSADAGSAVDDSESTTTSAAAARSLGVDDDSDDAMSDGEALDPSDDDVSSATVAAADQAESGDSALDVAPAALSGDLADGLLSRSMSLAELDELILRGDLEPVYTTADPIMIGLVSEACRATFPANEGRSFALARVRADDGRTRAVLLHFTENGSIETLDVRDCTPIG